MDEYMCGFLRPVGVASPSRRAAECDFDRSPYVAFCEVTRACDLVCVHCRACAQPRSDPRELATEQALALIEQLAEFPQPPILLLTGGDPFKRPDLFSLISRAVELGLETSIKPSATSLATSDALARLRDHGVKRIAVSLDGPTAASHDAVRGVAGSFRRTLEIAADARRCGLEVQVNTTLTSTNVDEIECMADLLDRLAYRIVVGTFSGAGRACRGSTLINAKRRLPDCGGSPRRTRSDSRPPKRRTGWLAQSL